MLQTCAICGTENLGAATLCAACGAAMQDEAPTLEAATYEVLGSGTKLQGGMIVLDEVLGQGGFGITYRGFDVLDERAVAVKEFFPYGCVRRGARVQPSSMLDETEFIQSRRAFADESGWLLRFRHPNIVSVLSIFEENNTAYLVMELLEGQTLEQMVSTRGALPEGEALIYIEQVAQALETLHGADLLHRDIKPDNIMVCGTRVVLLDFGAARSFAGGRTRRMTTLLTPGYAPLEQYGSRARFGRFTDIYALGATLFHLLTGQMPPSATDRISGTELMAPEKINPNISHLVSEGVLWAMQIKVDERPQTVPEWIRALRSGHRPAATLDAASVDAVKPDEENETSSPRRFSPSLQPVHHLMAALAAPNIGAESTDWHRVTIETRRVKWPQQCACCGAATSAFWPMPTPTATWEVPYCPPCRDHAEQGHSIAGTFQSLMGVCVSLGVILGLGLERWSLAALIGIALPTAMWLMGGTLLRGLLRLQRVRHETDCCDFVPAVRYRGRDGDIFRWEFRRHDYAEAFLQLNSPAPSAEVAASDVQRDAVAARTEAAALDQRRSRVAL